MNMLNLFSTPFWEFEYDDYNNLNNDLIRDMNNDPEIKKHPVYHYFELQTEPRNKLRKFIENSVQTINETYFENSMVNISINARKNGLATLQSDSPHHHPYTNLVAVYYVNVSEDSGDILLLDPRGSVPHVWEDKSVTMDGKKSARVFFRYKPTPGKLIFHPGYLFHCVETNLTEQLRISLVININFDLSKNLR